MPQPLISRFHALRHEKGTRQFVIFLLVGILNVMFGYGCFVFIVWLGVHYGLAALLATTLGVLFNFHTSGRLVFGRRDNRRLWRFIGVYVIVYTINLLGLRVGQWTGLGPYLTGALMLLPLAVLSYYLQGRFVFAAGAAMKNRGG